jgi:hypothetical protein
LLERAFQPALKRHLDPLLDTILSNLETIYPQYYQSLCSPTVSTELNRYIVSLFGILQIVLRSPSFASEQKSFHRKALDQHILVQAVKFSQLSDDIVNQWLEYPVSVVDESADSLMKDVVRTAVSTFAMEVFFALS